MNRFVLSKVSCGMLFYHKMYHGKGGALGFLIFLVLYKGTGDLCIPSTKAGTQERWDPILVSDCVTLFRRHIARCPMACVQLVPSFPTSLDALTSRGHLLPRNVYILPPSLILFLAGLKTYLNHKGSLIMLTYQGMLLEGGTGHDLFLRVVFLFSIRLFCLCARLAVKVLRSSQRELLENGLFYLQKFLAFIKPLYETLLSCLCQYTPTV